MPQMWGAVTFERFGLALGKLRHIFQPLKITPSASDCSPCNLRILLSWDVVNQHRNVLWSWKLYAFEPLFSLLFYAQRVNGKLRQILSASDGLQRVLCKGYISANLLCLDPPVLGLYPLESRMRNVAHPGPSLLDLACNFTALCTYVSPFLQHFV